MDKIKFEDGKLIEKAYVMVNDEKKEVQPAVYEGATPLKAVLLNKMQDNMELATKVTSIMPGGNSVQETREGYNLLKNAGTSKNNNGVDFVVNEDGTVLANGTATAQAQIRWSPNLTLPAGTYTFKDVFLFITDIKWVGNFLHPVTKTFEKEFTVTDAYIRVESGETVNNKIFYPMIVEGSYTAETMPPYETYGKSPSIEYEAPIKSAGDNINVFNYKDLYKASDGCTADDEGWITINANNTDTSKQRNPGYTTHNLKLKEDTEYSIISEIKEISGEGSFYLHSASASGGQFLGNKGIPFNTLKAGDIIIEKATTRESFEGIEAGTRTSCVFEIEEKGSITFRMSVVEDTTITPETFAYNAYGQGSIAITNCNKNLAKWESGWINSEGIEEQSDRHIRTNFINCSKNKTFTFSKKIITNTGDNMMARCYDENKKFIKSISALNPDLLTGTLTFENDIKFFRLAQGGISSIEEYEGMCEIGDMTTSYIPHEEQNIAVPTQKPFRAVGDVRDKFIKVDGMLYEKHIIKRRIFDSSEIYNGTAEHGYYIENNDLIRASDYTNLIKCNYYKAIKDHLQFETIGITGYSASDDRYVGQNWFYFMDNEFASKDDLKAKVKELYDAGKPLSVDYVSTEPELIPCTAEQIKALAEINSAYGEGLTNITCEDEVEPVIEIVKESKETTHADIIKLILSLSSRIEALENKGGEE